MNQKAVLQTIFDSDNLPVLPPVASKLITLASNEETPVRDIIDLISKDIALSAKVLKLANSSFYSMSNTVSTIKQAVSLIGTNGVLSLALSFSFLGISRNKAQDAFDYEKFREKSLASAVAAKLIKTKIDGIDLEKYFAAGLLLNIGELILAQSLPAEYQRRNRKYGSIFCLKDQIKQACRRNPHGGQCSPECHEPELRTDEQGAHCSKGPTPESHPGVEGKKPAA